MGCYMKGRHIRIKSVDQLYRALDREGQVECFLSLAGGWAKSSKSMWRHEKGVEVHNEIDDTYEVLTDKELRNSGKNGHLIARAMPMGCLIKYPVIKSTCVDCTKQFIPANGELTCKKCTRKTRMLGEE
jgi:hypothetical protein